MILRGTVIWTPALGRAEVRERAYLVADGPTVRGVFDQLPADCANRPVTDYGDALIIPAFVDAHVHAPQFLNAGIGMDDELLPWLNRRTFPLEARFADPAFADRAYRAFLNALWEAGTLRFCAFATVHARATWHLMQLAESAGFSGLVGKVNMDRNAPEALTEDTATSLAQTEELALRARSELRNIGFIATPRFVPSTTPALMEGLGALVEKHQLPVQSHVDENRGEVALVRELHPEARSYAHVYDDFGLMPTGRTVLAHAIWLTDPEVELLREKRVLVAHSPQSNANLTSGIMPARRWLSAGLSCAVASDLAAGSDACLARHAACAVQVSKLNQVSHAEETALHVPEALYLVTKGPGCFAGFAQPSGSFEPGFRADALVVGGERAAALDELLPRTPLERLERFLYAGDSRDICARYAAGALMERPF